MRGKYGGLFGALLGALSGSWVGFGLMFYGYLLLHQRSPGGVEFEYASTLGFFVGAPIGTLIGAVLGYRSGRRPAAA